MTNYIFFVYVITAQTQLMTSEFSAIFELGKLISPKIKQFENKLQSEYQGLSNSYLSLFQWCNTHIDNLSNEPHACSRKPPAIGP